VAGTVATGAALYLLLKEDVVAGKWSDSFILIPSTVLLAILSGHLFVGALKEWRTWLSAAAFGIAFLIATILTVGLSVSKQASTTQTTLLASEASKTARADKEAELARARLRYEQAQAQADKERGLGHCGPRCQDWDLRAREVGSHISKLEAELNTAAPKADPLVGEAQLAEIITLLTGYSVDRVKATILLFKPLLFSLLNEWVSIWAFGYGFGHRRRPQVQAVANDTGPVLSLPPPPKRGRKPDAAVIDWCKEFRRRNGRSPSIPEVQTEFATISKSSAWRYSRVAA
jgi:hypothetical protein